MTTQPKPNSIPNQTQLKPRGPRKRHDYVLSRARAVTIYVAQNRCTVREAAEVFKCSKSTIFLDLTERAPYCAPFWYKEARKVLDMHKAVRARRGGQAAARSRRERLADEFRARNSNGD